MVCFCNLEFEIIMRCRPSKYGSACPIIGDTLAWHMSNDGLLEEYTLEQLTDMAVEEFLLTKTQLKIFLESLAYEKDDGRLCEGGCATTE